MQRFLSALFPRTDHGFIELRCISAQGTVVNRSYVVSPKEAEQTAKEWCGRGHVYFGVVLRPKKGSKLEDVEGGPCNAVWADLDADTDDEDAKRALLRRAIEEFVLWPSIVIDTGRGYHLYWLFPKPIAADGALSEVVTLVGEKVGGDSVSDIVRIMRMPETLNYKTTPPRECRVVFLNPGLQYSIQDLEAATYVSHRIAAKVQTGSRRGYKSRSERDWAIITELVRAGLSDEAIAAVFQTRKCGDKYGEKGGEAYFTHTLTQAHHQVTPRGTTTTPITFVEKDDCYWMETAEGILVQLSTFTFQPEVLLEGDARIRYDALLGTIHAAGYEWPEMVLDKRAFARIDAMLKHLPVAAWQWLGSDASVRALLPYLMDKLRTNGLPKKQAHPIVGRIGDVWIAPKQTITRSRVIPVAEAEIVWMPLKQDHLRVDYQTCSDADFTNFTQELFELLPKINKPEVLFPVLGWYLAAPWKTILEAQAVRFPHLNLFGTRGSGKTSLNQMMQALFGATEPRSYDCNTTRFVLLTLLGCTNGVPIALSEFRTSTLRNPMKILRYLLLAYDTGHDPRGRPDQTVVDYELSAPIVVDGEDAIGDAAAKERIVAVNLSPETIQEGSEAQEMFEKLQVLPLPLFAARWITYTLQNDPPIEEAQQIINAAFPKRLPARVRRNVAVCVMGLLAGHKFLTEIEVPFPEPTVDAIHWWFGPALDHLVGKYGGRTETLVDELVTEAIAQVALDLEATRPTAFIYNYRKQDNTVWFHLTSLLKWWFEARRRGGQPTLGSSAIKIQIRERLQREDSAGEPGQYVISSGTAIYHHGSTKWMFGVDLSEAFKVLDVPDTLRERFTIAIGGVN